MTLPTYAALLFGALLTFEDGFVAGAAVQENQTFDFAGFIEFQQLGAVPGLSVGEVFQGSFTFDPLTPGVANTPPDITLDTKYRAITSWQVSILASSLAFSGSFGEIALGNNAPQWFLSDRYIVTMFPDSSQPLVVSGHEFRFFQINLIDYTPNSGADMLRDSSLPSEPPDLSLTAPSDRTGRFVFNDASFQNRMISLTAVPEPSQFVLALVGTIIIAFWSRSRKTRG